MDNFKKVFIPVAIGFVLAGLILAFVKRRFGIEIGDPVDLANDDDNSQDQE